MEVVPDIKLATNLSRVHRHLVDDVTIWGSEASLATETHVDRIPRQLISAMLLAVLRCPMTNEVYLVDLASSIEKHLNSSFISVTMYAKNIHPQTKASSFRVLKMAKYIVRPFCAASSSALAAMFGNAREAGWQPTPKR